MILKRSSQRLLKYILITIFGLLIFACIALFVIVPIIFSLCESLQRLLMFTNIGLPTERSEFAKPILGLRNIYLPFQDYGDQITLGVWHILPRELIQKKTFDFDDALANSNYSVVIHFHGSGETRMDSLNMYAILYEFFHVIAFDYRGYGDSTDDPLLSEYAIARDSLQLYNWVRNKTKRDIYFWGHSLGTALSTLTISDGRKKVIPTGLILEAPFTNMREEIPVHPYGKIFAWLPWFEQTILNPLDKNGFKFNSSRNILAVDCPIMVLHAEDDSIIPFTLGRKLAGIAKTERNSSSQGEVTYHQFSAQFGYDHFRIYRAPQLPEFIKNFMADCDAFKNKNK